MEREDFLLLVKNYTSLTSEEAAVLVSLQNHYPYSQILHNLAARAAQDNDLASREELLHVSAIYTTDRTVLKNIMTASRAERAPVKRLTEKKPNVAEPIVKTVSEELPPAVQTTAEHLPVKKETEKKSVTYTAPASKTSELAAGDGMINDLTGEALRKDIMAELKKLKESKHRFDLSLEEFEKHNGEYPVAKKSGKKTADPSDTLIEEIKTSKKKVAPEGKQKEQIEIIENFIKTKPSISKTKGTATPASPSAGSDDLAEKSLLYGDNIVSETLVEILLKQGKKDKAVEVLKKLIWKFPQKKAYFAARIDELKS